MTKLLKKLPLILLAVLLLAALIAANATAGLWKPFLMELVGVYETDYDSEASRLALRSGDEAVQSIAEDSVVLMKNVNGALPLSANERTVNLFGYGSSDAGFIHSGGGSSSTCINDDDTQNSAETAGGKKFKKSLIDAFEDEGFACNSELTEFYRTYSTVNASPSRGVSQIVQPPVSDYTADLMARAKSFSDLAVVVFSRGGSESTELPTVQYKSTGTDDDRHYLQLTAEEEGMLEKVLSAGFGKVVVLLNTGERIEAGFLDDDRISAAMYVGIPGQSGALAIPRLMKGYKTGENGETVSVTPSGRLSDTWAYSVTEANPTEANRFPSSGTWGEINYAEGIYVGYKWYETAAEEGYFDDADNGYDDYVQYPFGYGLSYTDFSWSATWETNGDELRADSVVSVNVRVTNRGDRPGKDVVQLYYTPEYYPGEIEKAQVNLIAFAKTEVIQPGKYADVRLTVSAYDMASYDCYDKNGNGNRGWELDRGAYKLRLMTDAHHAAACDRSSVTLRVPTTVNIKKDPTTGTDVVNKFTGDDAYMGVPSDGSIVPDGVTYLSREDFWATFPTRQILLKSKDSRINAANTARNTRYDTDAMPVMGVDGGLRLVTAADGSDLTSAQLDGDGTAVKVNEALVLELAGDYDSPTWNRLLDQMTSQEIRTMVQKGGLMVASAASVGKPRQTVFDGPAGFHAGQATSNKKGEWTGFPAECLIGCSWNVQSAYLLGRTQGEIANATGLSGWYAPGVNLHRNPFSGRYFEYFAEDPVLAGNLGAQVVRGARNKNLICYVKHFAVSEEGINPDNVYTWITEQAIRETYLKSFEITVKTGKTDGIMTAFNCIGSIWAGACDPLNNDILRDEWGFVGSVISDYSMGRPYMNTEQAIRAGNDFMLDAGGSTSPIDANDPTSMTCARKACKNIIYTWCNTYAAAKAYVDGGSVDIVIGGGLTSPVPDILHVAANVGFGLGLLVCLFFIFKPKRKKRKTADDERTEAL